MNRKYKPVSFEEVFPPEFRMYIENTMQNGGALEMNVQQIFNRIENYEKAKGLEFVSFFGSEFLIFKQA